MDMYVGLAIGLLFSTAIVSAYWQGFKHAKSLEKGIIPKVNLNPVQAIVERVTAFKEAKQSKIETEKQKQLEGEIENIMGYDGNMALETIKAERLRG